MSARRTRDPLRQTTSAESEPVNVEPLTSADPSQVGRYRIHARLGAGGMGTVYLAFTPGGRPVAVKMIQPELADNADFRNRFRQEVEAARRVHGLYTAQVLDADPDATPPWLVTAFVPGLSLQEGVSRHGPLPVDTVLVLMAGVAEALQVIHGAGVVHRDLKPSNVVLAPDGPRVIDFGIARAVDASPATREGIRIGSPHYMAPEQVADSLAGPAADVFALGSVAAYAALGRPPFGEGGALPVMYRVLHEPADLSGCPSPLRGIIERCLAKDAAARPSPAEVIGWCRAVTAGRTGQIAQPWLPAGVIGALAERPPPRPDQIGTVPERLLPPPGEAEAQDRHQIGTVPERQLPPPPGETVAQDRHQVGTARAANRDQNLRATPDAILAERRRSSVLTAASPPTRRLQPRRRRRLGWTLAVILALLVVPAAALSWVPGGKNPSSPGRGHNSPAAAPGSWLAGTWIGSADQPTGVVTHWTAKLTFSRSGRAGTFQFPSLGCAGTLIVTGTTATTASVDENLTRNPRKVCAPGGVFTLSRSGRTGMRMTWQDATDQNNVATAYLKPR
jgi:Protein kinase domain